ncbi:MAG: hypothetical protein QF367_12095, partial [Acidimicrobiales bacterium]|nr:hypothetical protein [Acidimicrobiales bacterium]
MPKIYQLCPSCDGRNILSQAFAEDFIDMNRIADDHDHDPFAEDFIAMNWIAHDHDHDHDDRECGDARSQPTERAGLCRVKASRSSDHDHDHDHNLDKITDDGHVMSLEYEDEDDDEPIMDLEEEVEVHVAADTGSVAHVVGPGDIPGSIRVRAPP